MTTSDYPPATIQPGQELALANGNTLHRLGFDEFQIHDARERVVASVWYSHIFGTWRRADTKGPRKGEIQSFPTFAEAIS